MSQKRVLSIQDISCTGRCSLTVALPILSAAGLETAILPTAVLSTHTGGFSGYTFCDLTDQIKPIEKHWETFERGFDAIQTGYLAPAQVDLMIDLVSRFKKKDTLVLVDPAMADSGKMYPGFGMDFARKMAGLASKADIVVPNFTEACFLLGREYVKNPTRAQAEDVLKGLAALGPSKCLISGLSFEEGKVGVLSYDRKEDSFDYFATKDIPGYFHGAGDIFAAGLLAGLENDLSLPLAARLAHDLVHSSIIATLEDEEKDVRFGLHFEKALPGFIEELNDMRCGERTESEYSQEEEK